MTEVYIDMDGTIVDQFERFYLCYSKTILEMKLYNMNMTINTFISRRKSGFQLFDTIRNDHPEFASIFDSMIEEDEMLNLDTIIPGMRKIIKTLHERKFDLCVVSYRANRSALLRQLSKIGIGTYVSALCTVFKTSYRPGKKAELIREYNKSPTGYIIGDDVYEIAAGKELGLTTIAVTWGSRNKEHLIQFAPDYIIDKPEQILEIIR